MEGSESIPIDKQDLVIDEATFIRVAGDYQFSEGMARYGNIHIARDQEDKARLMRELGGSLADDRQLVDVPSITSVAVDHQLRPQFKARFGLGKKVVQTPEFGSTDQNLSNTLELVMLDVLQQKYPDIQGDTPGKGNFLRDNPDKTRQVLGGRLSVADFKQDMARSEQRYLFDQARQAQLREEQRVQRAMRQIGTTQRDLDKVARRPDKFQSAGFNEVDRYGDPDGDPFEAAAAKAQQVDAARQNRSGFKGFASGLYQRFVGGGSGGEQQQNAKPNKPAQTRRIDRDGPGSMGSPR